MKQTVPLETRGLRLLNLYEIVLCSDVCICLLSLSQLMWKGAVFECCISLLGCRDIKPRIGWRTQQKFISQNLEAGSPKPRCQQLDFAEASFLGLQMSTFSLCPCLLFFQWVSLVSSSLLRASDMLGWGTPPHLILITSLKALFPDTVPSGLGPHHEFGGGMRAEHCSGSQGLALH